MTVVVGSAVVVAAVVVVGAAVVVAAAVDVAPAVVAGGVVVTVGADVVVASVTLEHAVAINTNSEYERSAHHKRLPALRSVGDSLRVVLDRLAWQNGPP